MINIYLTKMNKIKLTINGYKCFDKKTEFSLNNITLLTGGNSAGKSSVIQSILIAKLISESITSEIKDGVIQLSLMNKKYAIELGGYDDVINRSTSTGDIEFALSDIEYNVKGEQNYDVENDIINFSLSIEDGAKLKSLFSPGFTYLNADRMAPHYEYNESESNDVCDCHGSNVGDVFAKNSSKSASWNKSLNFGENIKLLMQIDEWCDYIFPGVAVRVERTGSQMYKLKVKGDVISNVGFGITYAFPILVSGLIANKGSILIVENPEAHLHAKAQSNMGYFLARMAAAGVRVIIETHSEHIVNGIRRMIIEGQTDMSHEDMTIYFFQSKNGKKNIKEITMDDIGNLSEFPVDFFDQVRQDMFRLMELGRNRVNYNEG